MKATHEGINGKGEYITRDWAVLVGGRVVREGLTEAEARRVAQEYAFGTVRRMN